MRKQTIYVRKFKSYSWVGLLGQPSGLAGGRVGPGGRDIWEWVNQYNTGPTSRKMHFLMKKKCKILGLLDVKHGSGSKFYAGYTGYEVWKS